MTPAQQFEAQLKQQRLVFQAMNIAVKAKLVEAKAPESVIKALCGMDEAMTNLIEAVGEWANGDAN
jgi:hypothetical protein